MVVFGLSIWLGLKPLEWAVIVLTTRCLHSGFLNTAIEAVVDLAAPPNIHGQVGRDVGAGVSLPRRR
jgi:diacylglycerol kinase